MIRGIPLHARIQIESLTKGELELLVHALAAYGHHQDFRPLHRKLAEQLHRHNIALPSRVPALT